jgi:hypothetical protein
MIKGMKGFIVLDPPNKLSFFIKTSLNEVFIEWMEYDDTFPTFSHCELTV